MEEIILEADFALTPLSVLSMWAAGMAGGAALVAYWRIVGRAFFWVVGFSTFLVGGWTLGSGGILAWVAVIALIGAMIVAQRPVAMAALLGVSAVSFLAESAAVTGWLPALTGAVALGGVTDEMLLGHWYLVDPKMPRWALRTLDVGGAVALVLDAVLLISLGALGEVGVVGWAFIGLAAMSILLMVGVWFALKEPAYAGVMAATGLSYLAVLTALGATVAGRSLIGDAANLLAHGIVPS